MSHKTERKDPQPVKHHDAVVNGNKVTQNEAKTKVSHDEIKHTHQQESAVRPEKTINNNEPLKKVDPTPPPHTGSVKSQEVKATPVPAKRSSVIEQEKAEARVESGGSERKGETEVRFRSGWVRSG